MIQALAVLLPLLAVSIWLFARAKPKEKFKKDVRRFNTATLGLVVVACVAVTLYFWQTTGQSNDHAWWPLLAVLASILASITILAIAGLVRTLLFRNTAAR